MSSGSSFFEVVESRSKSIDSLLCVGLDPHRAELKGLSDASTDKEVRGFPLGVLPCAVGSAFALFVQQCRESLCSP